MALQADTKLPHCRMGYLSPCPLGRYSLGDSVASRNGGKKRVRTLSEQGKRTLRACNSVNFTAKGKKQAVKRERSAKAPAEGV